MTTPAPALDALFEAPGVAIVPGLLRGLGIIHPADEPVETYEAFLERISQRET